MQNIKGSKNSFTIQEVMEIVAYSTCLGLLFPFFFLYLNNKIIPNVIDIYTAFVGIMILTLLLAVIIHGIAFPKLVRYMKIVPIMYIWGFFLLCVVAWLVYITGGVLSSIFTWLFEYALIVALIVSPKTKEGEDNIFRLWRPVLVIVTFEVFIIIALTYFTKDSILNPKIKDELMQLWGAAAIVFTLIASIILFYFSEQIRNRE